jgi:hypothetical protein
MAFVFIVIMAGPLIGLAWMWNPSTSLGAGRTTGARVIGVTMAASLLFGLVNHFVIAGADRVDHVVMEWRMMFGTTAATLAVIEAAGAWLGSIWPVQKDRPYVRGQARRSDMNVFVAGRQRNDRRAAGACARGARASRVRDDEIGGQAGDASGTRRDAGRRRCTRRRGARGSGAAGQTDARHSSVDGIAQNRSAQFGRARADESPSR